MSAKRRIERAQAQSSTQAEKAKAARLQELKAAGYDCIGRIEQLQAILRQINQEIANLSGDAVPEQKQSNGGADAAASGSSERRPAL